LRYLRHRRANHGIAPLAGVTLIGASLMMAAPARAQSVWHGPGSTTNTTIYNLGTNWGPAAAPLGPGQAAIFKGAGKSNLTVTGGPISPDSWTFSANSQSYSLSGADVNFSLAGANGGIINKANSGQTISIGNNIGETAAGVRVRQDGNSTLILSGVNTYSGGTLISNGGTLRVNNSTPGLSSSVGTGTVTLDNGQFQAGAANLRFSNNFAVNDTPAGSAIDNNNRVLTLSGNITDGNGPGMLTFVNSGSGSNPNARTILTGASSYTGGTVICNCAAVQLGDATHTASIVGKITNEGELQILNADTVGIMRIVNTGMTGFLNSTSAGTATIVNSALLEFANQSTAGAATIRNIGGATTFLNHSTAGDATIVNRAGGLIAFANNSTAGDATITTRQFAQTFFDDHSNGGNARFITNGTGVVDFSGTTGAGGLHQISAGSIEGSGTYFIGNGNTLATGGNNRSTEVSGVIADSCGCNPNDHGALQKVGLGTMILSGANTYSGGTIINAGTLQLGNGGASGSIVGNVIDNAAFALNRSDAFVFSGAISGSGEFQQTGPGTTTLTGASTYTGPTTVTAGTLVIAAGGSITSDVSNNANFNNAGTVTGALTNSATASNSGTITRGLTNLAGITTNSGTINGGVTVTAGTFNSNTAASIVNGGLTNAGTVNAAGVVSGGIVNNGAAVFNVTGNLAGSGAVTNNGAAQLVVSGGNFTGLTVLTNNSQAAAGITIAAGRTLSANLAANNAGSTIANAGTLTSVAGPLTNAGILNTSAATSIVSGGLTNTGTVNAAGAVNGAILNNAGTFAVTGALAGDGAFTNAASATLAVGGNGAYTLQGLLGNSGAVTVAGGGQLIATAFGIVNHAGGTITVAAGGTVKDDLNNAGVVTNNGVYLANVATNIGSIANAATGSWTGNVLGNAAAITNGGAWTGNVTQNNGSIDNNRNWTGTVSNAGTFNNNAGATVSGLLTNTAGIATNNGALNGGANVSGGLFTGTGSVANLTVSGGIFAPGNGTAGSSTTITGNLALQSGALYLVGLNPSTSSFASVSGTAALNSGAGAVFLAGDYVARRYTILTAAGGLNGSFASFDTLNIPGGFRASLSYNANDVFLNLDLILARYSGLSVNQQNVANALTNFFNASGGIPVVFGSLTPGGLTQVSGELATASQQTTFDAMNLFLGLLTDPFVAGRGGEPVISPTAASRFADESDVSAYASTAKHGGMSEREAYAAMAAKAPIRNTVYDPQWSVWTAGFGGSQTTDGNATLGTNTATSRVFGTAVGADYRFSPFTLAGFAIAGGGTSFSVNGLGTGRSDLFQAGAFVRHNNGPAYVSAALAYGWQDITTDRTVAVAGADMLRANFNANAFSGRVEGGYRFVTPWMAMGLTPYAAGQFTTFDLPAYAEQAIAGANTFALTYGSKNVTASRSELGLRTDKSLAMENGIFTVRGRAAWAHNFNPDRSIAATFQTLPGASFVVNGAAQAADAALVTGSAEIKWLNGVSLAATFEGEFSGVTRSYAGKGVARYIW
jgi:fibronectin-binding autotransporter adhesin